MRLKITQFDLIASLGGNCSAAGQLKHRGLRRFSLPLDYVLMTDATPVQALPRLLTNRFKGWLQFENAVEYHPPIIHKGQRTYLIQDRASGFKFIHHFKGPEFSKDLFRAVRHKMDRRIDRFYERVGRADRVLFVLTTAFAYEQNLAEEIYFALKVAFPRQDIHFMVMQFSAESNRTVSMYDDHLTICTHQRDFNIVYDNQFTAPEWCWMDSLEITGVPRPEIVRKKGLLNKWAFKIWWRLGEWLESRGAGVLNIRFRNFHRYHLADMEEAFAPKDGNE